MLIAQRTAQAQTDISDHVGLCPAARVMPPTPVAIPGSGSGSSAGHSPTDAYEHSKSWKHQSRCPKTLDALLTWLKERWAEEPFPDHIHARGIFDGSALGSPAENGQFAQHLYKPELTDDDNLYLTPLNAALCKMARGGPQRPEMPKSAENIWSLIRLDFDWADLATRQNWPTELYAHALAGALTELWHIYNPRWNRR